MYKQLQINQVKTDHKMLTEDEHTIYIPTLFYITL